eukprot:403341016
MSGDPYAHDEKRVQDQYSLDLDKPGEMFPRDMIIRLLAQFTGTTLPQNIALIEENMNTNKSDLMYRPAHSIVGSSRMIGCLKLGDLTDLMQKAVSAQNQNPDYDRYRYLFDLVVQEQKNINEACEKLKAGDQTNKFQSELKFPPFVRKIVKQPSEADSEQPQTRQASDNKQAEEVKQQPAPQPSNHNQQQQRSPFQPQNQQSNNNPQNKDNQLQKIDILFDKEVKSNDGKSPKPDTHKDKILNQVNQQQQEAPKIQPKGTKFGRKPQVISHPQQQQPQQSPIQQQQQSKPEERKQPQVQQLNQQQVPQTKPIQREETKISIPQNTSNNLQIPKSPINRSSFLKGSIGDNSSKNISLRKTSISFTSLNKNSTLFNDDDEMDQEDENEYPFDDGWKCSIF